MIEDIRCIIWKEWKSLFRTRKSRMQGIMPLLSPVGLAIFMSIQEGPGWFDGPMPVLVTIVAAAILSSITIPDAIAGERERGTLPTLLASRLPDSAILFGKLAVGVGVGVAATITVLVMGFIVANVGYRDEAPMFYSAKILTASLVYSFMMAWLVSNLGTFFSMRAATVQDATQNLMMVFMVPPLIFGVIITALLASGDPGETPIKDIFSWAGSPVGLTLISLGFLAMNTLLSRVAAARFVRSRLIGG